MADVLINVWYVQLLDRRGKVVQEREMQVCRLLTKDCMSEESDEDGTKTRHSPKWRSELGFYGTL